MISWFDELSHTINAIEFIGSCCCGHFQFNVQFVIITNDTNDFILYAAGLVHIKSVNLS